MSECAFYLKGKAQTQNKKHKHKKDGSEREEAEDESPSCEKQRSLGVVNIIYMHIPVQPQSLSRWFENQK